MRKRRIINVVASHHMGRYDERCVHVTWNPNPDENENNRLYLGSVYKTYYEHNGPLNFQPVIDQSLTRQARKSLRALTMGIGDDHIRPPQHSPFTCDRHRPLPKDFRWGIIKSRKWQSVTSLARGFLGFDFNGLHVTMWIVLAVTVFQWVYQWLKTQ
jgi:hypothetical protein